MDVTGLWGAESQGKSAKKLLCKNRNTNMLIYEKCSDEGARIPKLAGPHLLCIGQIMMKARSKL